MVVFRITTPPKQEPQGTEIGHSYSDAGCNSSERSVSKFCEMSQIHNSPIGQEQMSTCYMESAMILSCKTD